MSDVGAWWSYALAAVSLYVTWMVASKKSWPWLLAVAQQLVWIVYALVTAQYGFLVSALAFMVLNGRNYALWRREERAAKVREREATVT